MRLYYTYGTLPHFSTTTQLSTPDSNSLCALRRNISNSSNNIAMPEPLLRTTLPTAILATAPRRGTTRSPRRRCTGSTITTGNSNRSNNNAAAELWALEITTVIQPESGEKEWLVVLVVEPCDLRSVHPYLLTLLVTVSY